MSADLVAWLRAQLDDDERAALAADFGPWEVGPTFGARDNRVYVRQEGDLIDSIGTCVIAGQVSNMPRFRGNAAHIARHDPAHELNIVAAHRAILAEHVPWHFDGNTNPPDRILCLVCSGPNRYGEQCGRTYPCSTLRSLALAYSDRPGYREEWRPA